MRRLLLISPLLLMFVIAACGPTVAPADEADGETEQATQEATPEETEEAPNPLASIDWNQAEALEQLLPDEVDGTPMIKVSFAGDEAVGTAEEEFLDSLGATASDVSSAFAGDEEGELDLAIGAVRIAGVDTNRIEDEFRNAVEQAETGAVELEQINLGGKDVWTGFDEDQQAQVYFYAAGDVLFLVQTNDRELAEEALSQLP